MKILICPDKFKGSLSAPQVCDAIEAGVRKKYPDAEIIKAPLADGGEGTAEILTKLGKGKMVKARVHGPLFEEIEAEYGRAGIAAVSIIEMASASGLHLVPEEKRNPLETTTLGTGELIAHAIEHGRQQDARIVLCVGGSATNDAGIGMAAALGFKFYCGTELLSPVGKNLVRIDRIESPPARLRVTVLCDVTNPLFGPNGAAYVYGPQKGATPAALELLDQGLRNFEKVARETFGKSPDFPGAGAGGGIAGGASVFFNFDVRSGAEFVMSLYGLKEKIQMADLVITGEGKIDRQTLAGKVVANVAKYAAGKKVVAVCGTCELRKNEMQKLGISEVISLVDPFISPEEAMQNAGAIITQKMATFAL